MQQFFNMGIAGAFFFALGMLALSAPAHVDSLMASVGTSMDQNKTMDERCLAQAQEKRDFAIKAAKTEQQAAERGVKNSFDDAYKVCSAMTDRVEAQMCRDNAVKKRNDELAAVRGNFNVSMRAAQSAFDVSKLECKLAIPTCSVSADKTVVKAGEPVSIFWKSIYATQAYRHFSDNSRQTVDANGSVTVNPQRTTTYLFKFQGAGGHLESCHVTVKVTK